MVSSEKYKVTTFFPPAPGSLIREKLLSVFSFEDHSRIKFPVSGGDTRQLGLLKDLDYCKNPGFFPPSIQRTAGVLLFEL